MSETAQQQRPKYLTTADLAALLDVSVDTVKRMRAGGTGPEFIKVNGNVRYAPWTVRKWSDDKSTTGGK